MERRSFFVEGQEVRVFDAALSPELLSSIYNTLAVSGFGFRHATSQDTHQYEEWAAELDLNDFDGHPLSEIARSVVLDSLKAESVTCNRVLASASQFGGHAFTHRDSEDTRAFTAIFYANEVWENDWGGETVFFDETFEAVGVVGVKPGRLVLFPSNIMHKAGIPSRMCPLTRVILSIRYTCD